MVLVRADGCVRSGLEVTMGVQAGVGMQGPRWSHGKESSLELCHCPAEAHFLFVFGDGVLAAGFAFL